MRECLATMHIKKGNFQMPVSVTSDVTDWWKNEKCYQSEDNLTLQKN